MSGDPKDIASSILVAIPCLNEARHIEACLTSLNTGHASLANIDMVVADGGSTDETRAIVARLANTHPNISLIDNPQTIQSAGVNQVVTQAAKPHHKILVRCDAHATYPANYVLDVATQLTSHKVEALATTLDAVGKTCFAKGAAWVVDTPLGSGGSAHRGGTTSGYVDHGHHAGLDIAWFRKIGGYDPSLPINEDADYDTRLHEAGGRVWLAADIRVDYVMRANPKGLTKQYWRYGKGRAQTTWKNRSRPALRQLAPAINAALVIVSLLLTPVSALFWAWPMIYGLAVLAVSIALALRHQSLCGLFAGPAMAIMHMSWGTAYVFELLKSLGRKP